MTKIKATDIDATGQTDGKVLQVSSSKLVFATASGGGGGVTAPISNTPGTGSAALTAPSKGVPAIHQLRKNMCGLFRFDDGSAWEIRWCFWDGTNVVRPTGGFVASSTGSAISLTSSATVTLIDELGTFQRSRGEAVGMGIAAWSSSLSTVGLPTASQSTPTTATFADTNIFTREPQVKYSSATTANASGGRFPAILHTSRNTGFHTTVRWGASSIPTGTRLCLGFTNNTSAMAADPSAFTDMVCFGKDSADTNIQFMVNDSAGTATKTDTGMVLNTNVLYESSIWCDPAGNCYGLLVDYSNQAIWYGSASTDLPTASTGIGLRTEMALGSTTGTASTLHLCSIVLRTGL